MQLVMKLCNDYYVSESASCIIYVYNDVELVSFTTGCIHQKYYMKVNCGTWHKYIREVGMHAITLMPQPLLWFPMQLAI